MIAKLPLIKINAFVAVRIVRIAHARQRSLQCSKSSAKYIQRLPLLNCTQSSSSRYDTIEGRLIASCPFRKSDPDVLMMQSGQDWDGDNDTGPLDCSMQGRIFL
jgi:hypothetical protein